MSDGVPRGPVHRADGVVTLPADASQDVGLILDARGTGADTVDFGKAVGSAMAVSRLAAAWEARGEYRPRP